jgi:hypothetical protein
LCTLTAVEFLDKLLQHIPTPGFQAVRRYGLYTGRNLRTIPPQYKIPQIALENAETSQTEEEIDDPSNWEMDYANCPQCGTKCLIVEVFMPKRLRNKPENQVKFKKKTAYENST